MFNKEHLSNINTADDLKALSWMDFEYLSKYLLEERGDGITQVTPKTGAKGGDGGVDLKIKKINGEVTYVQCKHWSGRHNGLSKSIRELSGCMTRDGVKNGIFIVSVESSSYEKEEARKMNIELIDSPAIFSVLKETRKSEKVEHKEPFNLPLINSTQKTVSENRIMKFMLFVGALLKLVFLLSFSIIIIIFYVLVNIVIFIDKVLEEGKARKPHRKYRSKGKRKRRYSGYQRYSY
ncbi:restriction endonuclease [Candidatus Peregrinibacteria bacterium]|jgi:hypothetical protein|nr:restriction endonuclease [Candidatus Peregrinibacteria bacterium]